MPAPKTQKSEENIYDAYRRILNKPELTDSEIDEMRVHVTRLARTICTHVWDEDSD